VWWTVEGELWWGELGSGVGGVDSFGIVLGVLGIGMHNCLMELRGTGGLSLFIMLAMCHLFL
jgi:hypothetical protein